MLIFELDGFEWDLSVMRTNYKLTKGTKTELFENILKMNNIKNFKTIRSKLTASKNIINSNLNSKLKSPLSFLRAQKN